MNSPLNSDFKGTVTLANQPSASVSLANEVSIRSNNGLLEISENSAAYHSLNVMVSALGTLSGDVVNKVGSSVADASVHVNAKLLSVRTGLGGSEVEYAYLTKQGLSVGGASLNSGKNVAAFAQGSSAFELSQGTSNITPSIVVRQTGGGKAAALGASSNGAFFAFDNAGFFVVEADARANIDAGNPGAGTTMLKVDNAGIISAPQSGTYQGGTNFIALQAPSGGSSGDVCVKLGTTLADGSVNSQAKLVSVRTGLGGSEVEHLTVLSQLASCTLIKGSDQTQPSNAALGSNTTDLFISQGAYRFLVLGPSVGARLYGGSDNKLVGFDSGGNLYLASEDKAIAISGTDSSASPGAATINKANGISAIANGASSVKITNSLASTARHILVTFHGDHGAARWWVVRNADGFTVTLSGAASADTAFSWALSTMI